MTDQSTRSTPETSEALRSATSSRASEDGRTPSDSQVGPTTQPSVDRKLPMPILRRRRRAAPGFEDERHLSTERFSASSKSAALSLSLAAGAADGLGRSMETAGSTLYTMTWSEQDTPSGEPYSLLQASVRPTRDTGCISWPTPVASDTNPSGKLTSAAWLMAFGRARSR